MSLIKFYNIFHLNSSSQTKIIGKNNFTYSLILGKLIKFINNSKNLTILDFGCGVGTLSFYFANQGHTVEGYDISSEAIHLANLSSKKLNLEKKTKFYNSKIRFLNKQKRRFNLIICSEVLEHIKNDKEQLSIFYKSLKKGGKIFISVPSKNAPLYKLGISKKFDLQVGHLRRYSEKDIKEILIKTNYSRIRIYKSEGILRNSLYLIKPLNIFIRFIKGPLTPLVNFIDRITAILFGESDLIILAQKI